MTTPTVAKGRPYRSTGCLSWIVYLLTIGALAVLALDAAEYISLGIVKDVIGMKVLTMEQFTTMETELNDTKEQLGQKGHFLEEVEKEKASVTGERDGLKKQVEDLSKERDEMKNKANAATGEVDGLKKQIEDLKKQVGDLTGERDGAKKELEEAQKKITEIQATVEKTEEKAEEEKKDERMLRGN